MSENTNTALRPKKRIWLRILLGFLAVLFGVKVNAVSKLKPYDSGREACGSKHLGYGCACDSAYLFALGYVNEVALGAVLYDVCKGAVLGGDKLDLVIVFADNLAVIQNSPDTCVVAVVHIDVFLKLYVLI
jgi:hypothetical protein